MGICNAEGVAMQYTGQMVVPWRMPEQKAHVMAEHVARYAWAMQWIANKRVVDLGCGTGYGALMLSWAAEGVIGIDNHHEAIKTAMADCWGPNLTFVCADLTDCDIPDADVYIAFETLEHLDKPEALIERVEGTLLWSLPLNRTSPHHKHDYTLATAQALASGEYWYQKKTIIVPQQDAFFGPDNLLGVTVL